MTHAHTPRTGHVPDAGLPVVVRTATPDDLPAVARVLAAAFDEPVTRWLVPDPARHPAAMTAFFRTAATDALSGGTVDLLTDPAGHLHAAALWFDHTTPPPDTRAAGDTVPDPRYDDAFGADAHRWHTLDRLMTTHHPAVPHHYLLAIGVHPDQQGHGLGGHLLRVAHGRTDPTPTYLEATSGRSRRLYRRHGYTDHPRPFRLPDGPFLWPMWRSPRIPAGAGTAGRSRG